MNNDGVVVLLGTCDVFEVSRQSCLLISVKNLFILCWSFVISDVFDNWMFCNRMKYGSFVINDESAILKYE